MREIKLSAGTIEYEDTGGDGPVLPSSVHPEVSRLASPVRK
jgi:hypothetical protein